MVSFNITILGNGSAVPTSFQHPSSQLVTYGSKRFLIDCGEGTQMQMIAFKTGHRNIDHIFISHLHGDHFFGLIGLVNTFHLFGRTNPLHIYAPSDIRKIIDVQLAASKTTLRYNIIYHALEHNTEKPIYEDNSLQIVHFPLNHRIPTYGFVFKEKAGDRKLKKSFVAEFNPSIEEMHAVKQGLDFETETGRRIDNREITDPPPSPRSYAFCSDTAYFEEVIPFIRKVDLLYHEATFDNSQEEQAADKYHSTAAQAALIAKKAEVGKLLLGHYSARFKDNAHLLLEAKEVFSNSELSVEGERYEL